MLEWLGILCTSSDLNLTSIVSLQEKKNPLFKKSLELHVSTGKLEKHNPIYVFLHANTLSLLQSNFHTDNLLLLFNSRNLLIYYIVLFQIILRNQLKANVSSGNIHLQCFSMIFFSLLYHCVFQTENDSLQEFFSGLERAFLSLLR